MKKYFSTYLLKATVALLLIVGFTSCNLGEIGWPTDPAYNHLFTPLTFSASTVGETSVSIDFMQVVGAKKYILEISEDSMQFTNIVSRKVMSSDVLTAISGSSSAVNMIYRLTIPNLNADSYHSARFLAVNADSTVTSKYATLVFRTKAENIITKLTISGSDATIKWHSTEKLSFLRVVKNTAPTLNILQTDSMISAQELTDSTKTFSGLAPGTYYTARVYYQEGAKIRTRGSITFKTPGTAGSYVCMLKPTDVITDSLNAFVAAGKTNVSFVLQNEVTYNFSSLVVPSGMVRLTFTAPDGVQPVVNIKSISPVASMDGFLFENIKMVGSAAYLFSFGSAISFSDFTFSNCSLDNYNSIVYFKNFASNCQTIVMDKCVITNVGGYGVVNIAGTSVKVGTIKITNSTFVTLSSQLMDIRAKMDNITVSNCTFYNNSSTVKLAQLFRFASNDLTPGILLVDKCIFAGNNGGATLKSISSNYANTATLSFSTSYRTSDFPASVATGVSFTNVNALTLSSIDLFTDPANNLFTIKPKANFDGRGIAGDPRWW